MNICFKEKIIIFILLGSCRPRPRRPTSPTASEHRPDSHRPRPDPAPPPPARARPRPVPVTHHVLLHHVVDALWHCPHLSPAPASQAGGCRGRGGGQGSGQRGGGALVVLAVLSAATVLAVVALTLAGLNLLVSLVVAAAVIGVHAAFRVNYYLDERDAFDVAGSSFTDNGYGYTLPR